MADKRKLFVGIDTSNYTTSVAVCDGEGRVLANIKKMLPVAEGERGLRQSDAVFHHTKNLPFCTDALGEFLSGLDFEYEISGIGVSATPRDGEGSYMPCFLCGIAAAEAFAASRALQVYQTSHQHGHVMAAAHSSGESDRLLGGRFLAFHVSGGTTEALLVTPNKDKSDFDIELVGETKDINAGQAIDRVGVMMGLAFPCGRELEKLAASFEGKIEKRRICVSDGSCSLSGVENIATKMYKDTEDKQAVAAFVFDFICRTLREMTDQILEKYGEMPVLYAGGVMSNKLMRSALAKDRDAHFAEAEFSADNAAGVALLARLRALAEVDG